MLTIFLARCSGQFLTPIFSVSNFLSQICLFWSIRFMVGILDEIFYQQFFLTGFTYLVQLLRYSVFSQICSDTTSNSIFSQHNYHLTVHYAYMFRDKWYLLCEPSTTTYFICVIRIGA